MTGGSATLAGTLTVVPQYAFYNSGSTWTILTTNGGVTGTLTTASSGSPPVNWIFVPVSTGDAVALTFARAAYAASATSARSSATGAGLNAAAYSATGEMATLIQYLDYSYGFDSNRAAWSVTHNALTNSVLNVLNPQGGWHVDIGTRAGYDAFQSTRNLPLATYSGTAKATWNGWNTSIAAGGGYGCKLGAFDMGPFVSVQWQHAHEDGFRESRVGTLGQSLRNRRADALTTIVGGRVSRTFETAGGLVVTPEIRAGWSAEWLSNPGYITSSFLGSPASVYQAVSADQRYHSMLLDAGVTVRLKERLSFSAKVGAELLRPGHEAQVASVGLKYSF